MTRRWGQCWRPKLFSLVIACLALGPPSRALASTAELAAMGLDELMDVEIVSVARRAQPLGEVAAAVFVITQDDIRRVGARSLGEALRLAPGMDVAQLGSARDSITARGFPGRYANKLQVLVDGRSLYWELTSGVVWEAERVPMADIERIEVIRGPAGAVWGANAVNGVINVITRPAAAIPGTRTQTWAASDGARSLAVQHGWQGGEGGGPDMRLYAQSDATSALSTTLGGSAQDASHVATAGLRADWRPASGESLTLQGQVLRSDTGDVWRMPSVLPPYVDPTLPTQHFERAMLTLAWERALSPGLTLAVQGNVSHATGNGISMGRYGGDNAELDARWTWLGAPGHEVTWGGGGRWTDSRFDTPPDAVATRFDPARRRLAQWYLYGQDEVRLGERWRLTLGARLDHHPLAGSQLQPSARLLWKLGEQSSAWAALSRAARVPSRVQADALVAQAVLPPRSPYNPGGLPLLLAIGQPPGTLPALEAVEALELGWRTRLRPGLSLDVAAHASRYRNTSLYGPLAAPVAVGTGPAPYLLSVMAPVFDTLYGRGLEVALDWRITPRWRQQLSYTFERFNDNAPRPASFAQLTPQHIVLLRNSLELSARTTLDLVLRHTSERSAAGDAQQHLGALTELDLHLLWCVVPGWDLSLGGRNLLHARSVQAPPSVGAMEPTRIERSLVLGLQGRF